MEAGHSAAKISRGVRFVALSTILRKACERTEYGRDDRGQAYASRRSGAGHGRAIPAVPAWPFQTAASHRDGATDPLAGAPAGQCAKLPRRLLLRPTRIRGVDRN